MKRHYKRKRSVVTKSLSFKFTIHDGETVDEYEVTSVRATAIIGVTRFQMMIKGEEENKKEEIEALKPLRLVTYPSCKACSTIKKNGVDWNISFEEFVNLDEVLVNKWMEQVDTLNPHWSGNVEAGEATEKK